MAPSEKPTDGQKPVKSFEFSLQHLTTILIPLLCFGISYRLLAYNSHTSECTEPDVFAPRFTVFGKNKEGGHLKHVRLVLDRLGYEEVDNGTDWDLMWAHDYPFRVLYSALARLEPYQKLNHFPGSGFLTNKVELATSGLDYIPPAFRLPEDKDKLLKYSQDNPDTVFILKANEHRGIKIKSLADIDLDANGSFVQKYVDKPFLVDGYKFDIGVYVIVTSIDPLRVYIYNGDILFRYCMKKYYPFDADDIDKYVIGDDYLPTWEVPSLDVYYNKLGFSMRDSFNAYVISLGMNPDGIWAQIENSIRTVLLKREPQLIQASRRFRSTANFFEMMRFDFVLDEDLNVHLMEANMSPNLSSAHYPPNQLLYEQVLYNMLALVGVGSYLKRIPSDRSKEETMMIVAEKNVAVFPEECSSSTCRTSCMSPQCHLCRPCLDTKAKLYLSTAYREYVNRMDCKRIFPPAMEKYISGEIPGLDDYSSENQLQFRWFLGKCKADKSWC